MATSYKISARAVALDVDADYNNPSFYPWTEDVLSSF